MKTTCLTVPCPTCGAGVGVQCRTMSRRILGESLIQTRPHAARRQASREGQKKIHTELQKVIHEALS